MKRVLAISPTLADAGFNQRLALFVQPLAEYGFQVDTVQYPSFFGRGRVLGRLREFDLIWLRRKTLDPFAASAFQRSPVPSVFDFDDAIMLRAHPKAGSFRSHTREQRFRRTLEVVDAVFVGSEYLAGQVRPFDKNVHVVPTSLDVRLYKPKKRRARPEDVVRLVWIGSGSTLQFLLERYPLFRRIARTWPQVRLRVICHTFPEWDDIPLEKVAWSEETEARALAESDIGISLMPNTPFTRGKCGFKLIQYMAVGLPVVTDPVGSHTEIVQNGKTGLLADSDESWLEAIRSLIENPEWRLSLGRAGRRRVEERYDVSVLVKVIAAAMNQLT